MITAQELRIGNLLNYQTAEGKQQIVVVNWKHLKSITEDPTGFNLFHSPIELTEEKLLKFGFVKDYEGHFALCFNGRVYYYDLENGFLMKDYKVKTKLNQFPFFYVHQLQNLFFDLSSEELTYTP